MPVDLLEVAPLPLLLELPFILIVWLATWLVALDCLLELMVLPWLRLGCCLYLLVFAFGLELWLLLVESSLLSSSVCWHSDSSIGLVPCVLEDLFGWCLGWYLGSLFGLGWLLLRLGLDRTVAGMAGPWTDGLRSSGVWLLLTSSLFGLLVLPWSGSELWLLLWLGVDLVAMS